MAATLLWFRRDLRLSDNPALQAILGEGRTPVPVYIHDDSPSDWPPGAASAWWLHHSLTALQQSLHEYGSDLLIFRGDPEIILPKLMKQAHADSIAWNRCYEPACVQRDKRIKQALVKLGYNASSHSAALLREPWTHLKKDGTPYRVFTPFWKKLHAIGPARATVQHPGKFTAPAKRNTSKGITIDALKLLPTLPWDRAFYDHWQPGEDGAWKALESFCEDRLPDYTKARDVPENSGTSRVSAHLHFGEISPVQVWSFLVQHASSVSTPGIISATDAYLREIAWREFSYHLLYHFPHTSLESMDKRFTDFPWKKNYRNDLKRWQAGQTGIPLVDAGMRELWETGYMHNRVRMIVASFLTKNLQIPWQEGARWFWDTLVDADLANNTMGWQWTAGSGADAAPYFRIFNPVLQGEKFDKQGHYLRRWVPELAKLDNRYLHQPWSASPALLADAGIVLGKDYPEPLVDLQESRRQALTAWDQVKRLHRA